MSSIAAISSASSSSASIPTEADTNSASTGWKSPSFSQKSRKAFFSLAKTVSARTIGLFALRTPEFSPHFAHSAPSSPKQSTKIRTGSRGSIPHFSTPRGQLPLPKIIITPADDDEEASEVEPLTDSYQDFSDLFWPYHDTDPSERYLPKQVKRDRPFFGFKRASMAIVPSPIKHAIAPKAPEMPESTPKLFYDYEATTGDAAIDKNKECRPNSSMSMNAIGVAERSSFDLLSISEINFMLGKFRRAHKSRYSTASMDEYADTEMDRSEYEHDPFTMLSPAAVHQRPVMTAQYTPTIKAISRMVSHSSS